MPTLIDAAGPRADSWTRLEAADADALATAAAQAAPGADLLVTLDAWQSAPELLTGAARLGVLLEPDDPPEALTGAIDRLALVAVRFPSFTDGRGYSTARLLRERMGFMGELRAVGDVQRDQVFYLARCGFDSFELRDGEDAQAAVAALATFSESYQGAHDRGPLFERRFPQAARARKKAVVL